MTEARSADQYHHNPPLHGHTVTLPRANVKKERTAERKPKRGMRAKEGFQCGLQWVWAEKDLAATLENTLCKIMHIATINYTLLHLNMEIDV